MLKNVILDMGNVLLDYNPEIALGKFCSPGEERDVIRKELFHGPEWKMGDRGDIKDADRYDLIKVRVPAQFHKALKACSEQWDICMKPFAGAREFCTFVKDQGYGIYVLSNASDAFYEYFPKFLPIDFFNGVFVSSNYRMLKPDVEIYKRFLKEYDLKPEECLFVDDMEVNVEAAKQAGMNAFRFNGNYDEVIALTS